MRGLGGLEVFWCVQMECAVSGGATGVGTLQLVFSLKQRVAARFGWREELHCEEVRCCEETTTGAD